MDWNTRPHQRGLPSNVGAQQARFLDSIGASSLRHKNADGSESLKINGRLYVNPADENGYLEISRLCWLPEGIVITPKTASNPLGWGLPPTPDGKGTIGGDFPYVVINQYEHNNTPEYLHTVYSRKASKTTTALETAMTLNWPLSYVNMRLDDPDQRITMFGKPLPDDAYAVKGNRALPQFVATFVPLLSERRQGQWFCHRPKLRENADPEHQRILDDTNKLRAEAATPRPPLSKPLEGWTPDLAMTTTMVNAIGGKMEHESPSFVAHWRTPYERVWLRAGLFETTGENLYVQGGRPEKSLGEDAVSYWHHSPEHYSNIVHDWTQGARAIAAADNQPQLIAEILTTAVWRTVRMSLPASPEPASYRQATQVMISASPRGVRSHSWRHPVFGKMSVSAPPSALSLWPTRNINWGERGFISYKQMDISVSNTDGIETAREQPVGAALHISQGVRRMTDEQFDSLLLKKRQADTSYNASRVARGQAVDAAIVGAENDLTPAMTGWDVRMRSLIYREVGQKYAAPNATNTVCSFILMEGQANDFLASRQLVDYVQLPFNPCTFSSAASFSEDGSKCVVVAGEQLQGTGSDAGRWDGERLHFYEFDGASFNEVATSEIDIEVSLTRDAALNILDYKQTALGQCKIAGYYDGNTLKWVEMAYDCEGAYIYGSAGASRRIRQSLVFGGIEWVYCDTSSNGTDSAVTGTLKHILDFDPLHLDRAHWVEYTFSSSAPNVTLVSAEVRRNMAAPVMVKNLYANVTVNSFQATSSLVWLVPVSCNKTAANPAGTAHRAHPKYPWTRPESDFKASFRLGGGSLSNPAGNAYFSGGSPRATPFAPVSFLPVVGAIDSIASASVLDAYVFGAVLHSQPFGIGTADRPIGDEVHIKSSNLDLATITGIFDLSDDILPIWSL